MKKGEPGYEKAMAELEEIVKGIETGDVDIDLLAAQVKRASELITLCRNRLRGTRDEMRKILDALEVEADEAGGSE